MYALVAKNCELQNFARLLLATEIQSVRHYWHLYPNAKTETAYPEQVFRNFATVGNVMDTQAGPWLFWGAEKLEITGIEMLPFTPITEYVIDVEWGQAAYAYASVEFKNPNVTEDWKNLMYMAHAQWDPVTAFVEAAGVSDWGSGNTLTNSLWFIATRAATANKTCLNAPTNGIPILQGLIYSKSANAYLQVGTDSTARATASLQGATVFNFGEIAGGNTIQDAATKQYASADASGRAPLILNRAIPSSWETFTATSRPEGYFTILAHSNGDFLAVDERGVLLNNITTTQSAVPDVGLFKFVCVGGGTNCPTPPSQNYTYTPQPTINNPPITSNCPGFERSKQQQQQQQGGKVKIL